MEKNLAKFLVPELLCQALPIRQANFPSVVKHCSHIALTKEGGEAGTRRGSKEKVWTDI